MRRLVLILAVASWPLATVLAQDPQPTCRMCPATYVASTEIQEYVKKAIAEKLTDQQVRDVEIGKSHVGIGVVHRGKLAAPAPDSVAEHDFVSDVLSLPNDILHGAIWYRVLVAFGLKRNALGGYGGIIGNPSGG